MMKKFFKQSIGILTGILLLGSVFAAVQQWNNSKLEISQKRMLFTDTGLPGGNCILDVNSGGNIIACTGIQDVLGNVYITGGALSGYLTGYIETDPIYMANSGLYYLATNPSGYIDASYLLWQYAGGLLTPINTGSIKFHVGAGGSANGTDSIALGFNVTAQGNNGISIGSQTQAVGSYATAMGRGSIASGTTSFAFGHSAETYGMYSFGLGYEVATNAPYCFAVGKYNEGLSNSIFEIGMGTATGDLRNAMTILDNGYAGILTSAPTQALTVSGIVKSEGALFKSGTAILPVTADTGDAIIAMSGGRLTVMYRSGGWVMSSYLTP